jgi:hypothetical protein
MSIVHSPEWLGPRVVWFHEDDLRRHAGDTLYARGLGYLNEVDDLCWSPGAVTATVRGSAEYQVRLSDNDGSLNGNCSCPWGAERPLLQALRCGRDGGSQGGAVLTTRAINARAGIGERLSEGP